MFTARVIIAEAMRALKALGVGDMPTIDELTIGLEAVQNIILDIHNARGSLVDVDLPGTWAYPQFNYPLGPGQQGVWSGSWELGGGPWSPWPYEPPWIPPPWWPPPSPCAPATCPTPGPLCWCPSENQRIRIQAGATVTITLPNAIPLFSTPDPYDYGFNANTVVPAVGTTGAADGIEYRQPRDGARIEIVGASQALYFYRADINSWMTASGLILDAELPFNNRYSSALGALVAERLMETLPGVDEPTPGLAKRIARGRSALMLQTGTMHDPVVAVYL